MIFIAPDVRIDGAATGPLAGRRFAVKDNIDVAGVATTAACPAFSAVATRSAAVVEKLLAAGASLHGKTNLDQFACGLVGTRSPYGAVRNAFDERYISGGSSSGSAVAVTRGLVDFAIGTDTAGSGRVPAGFGNIVGLKPSRGLVSSRGLLPACRHLDCTAIFARTVTEAVDVLQVIGGFDPEDPFSRPEPLDAAAMPVCFRFGVPAAADLEFFGDALARAAFDDAVARLESLGGTRVEIDFAPFREVAVSLYEDAWVAERYAAIRTFVDVHGPEMDPAVRSIIESGRRFTAADLFDAIARLGGCRQRAVAALARVDVLVVPTTPTIYTIDAVMREPVDLNRRLGYYTNAVNLLDLAALAVPSSIRPDGLPSGITLVGPWGSDLRLADLGVRYHAATGLCLGIGDEPVPAATPIARRVGDTIVIAVVGAHLDGLPLNGQLVERGARLIGPVRTAPCYRLYALAATVPPKPGLVRVVSDGAPVSCELWEMPLRDYGSFVALVAAPLGIGTIDLEDGRRVQGFLCESAAVVDGALDITAHGGWRGYLASLADPARPTASTS